MIDKRDRYRGALVGVLAGDALLAPYETWNSDAIEADMEKRGGLVPFDYPDPWGRRKDGMFPAGRPTDDSDQTAALALSLIANRGLNEEDLFNRLRVILKEQKSPLWEGKAVGAGKTTRDALRPAIYAESQARDCGEVYPSNGSLMRSAPLALFIGSEERYDGEIINRASRVTHEHELSCDCSGAYTLVLLDLLQGKSTKKAVQHTIFFVLEGVMKHPKDHPIDPGKWPERGNVGHTLHVALWSLLNASDFRDGLTKVAKIGGDTDTNGAVAGGLLGAKFGVQGIPEEWQDVLKGREMMIDLADQLYDIAHL